jgi:hypothetical protein
MAPRYKGVSVQTGLIWESPSLRTWSVVRVSDYLENTAFCKLDLFRWSIPSPGMWRSVDLIRTDVSEEHMPQEDCILHSCPP